MFRSRGAVAEPPETAAWPTRPEQCGGLIADRCRALDRAEDQLGNRVRQLRDYRQRLRDLENLVRDADPASDFQQVAAALAGITVLQRAIDLLVPQVEHADQDWRAVLAMRDREFARAIKLIRLLTGKQPPEDDDRSKDVATLTSELQVLIGRGPE